MALVPITHVYDTLSVINNTGLLDGQILYTTDQTVNKIFADVKVNNILRRIEIGGTNTIDTVLDQTSGHAIANSAVAKLAQTVHTNLLNPTLQTTTNKGVTCTNNGDGTYTLNGTATDTADFHVILSTTPNRGVVAEYQKGKVVCLTGCPNGGSNSTYKLVADIRDSSWTWKKAVQTMGTNGINIEPEGTNTDLIDIYIRIYTGVNCINLTFKPMLTTDLSATYDDYVQYSGDGEINSNVADLYNRVGDLQTNLTSLDTKVGAQSLLPTPSQSVTQNINTLKAEINQLNADLSSGLRSISILTSLTSGLNFTGIDFIEQLNKHFMLFNCKSNVPITSNVAMPIYSKGIFITPNDSGASDGMLLAVDSSASLYVAFRNGSNWNYARVIKGLPA